MQTEIRPASNGLATWRPGACVRALRRRALLRCRRGATALEFAFVGPILLTVLLGIFFFGIAINNYLLLTNCAQQAAQALALARGATINGVTTNVGYYSALYAIQASQGVLTIATSCSTVTTSCAASTTPTGVSVSFAINGTACTSSSCTISTAGVPATVTLKYPCSLTIMGINYGGTTCLLQASSAYVVQ